MTTASQRMASSLNLIRGIVEDCDGDESAYDSMEAIRQVFKFEAAQAVRDYQRDIAESAALLAYEDERMEQDLFED